MPATADVRDRIDSARSGGQQMHKGTDQSPNYEIYVESRIQGNGAYRKHHQFTTDDWRAAFEEIREGYAPGEYTHEWNVRRVGRPWSPHFYMSGIEADRQRNIATYGRQD